MENWALIHRYNKLVADGQARPFTCPDCEEKLVYMLGNDDNVVLWCMSEDKRFNPGTAFFADVRAVVTEFYLE